MMFMPCHASARGNVFLGALVTTLPKILPRTPHRSRVPDVEVSKDALRWRTGSGWFLTGAIVATRIVT